MATDSARKAFQFRPVPDQAPLREKDNAQPTLKPVLPRLTPANNIAPAGAKGIQTGLNADRGGPTTATSMRFELGSPGDLKSTFKPLVAPEPSKTPEIDR